VVRASTPLRLRPAPSTHPLRPPCRYSYIIQNIEFERIIESDMLMAIGSILFVWFWMTVHTRSALVGATGILQIVLSLLVALFFYRMCFQILYFQVRSISRRRTISCPCRRRRPSPYCSHLPHAAAP
jgi:hypothetical protein